MTNRIIVTDISPAASEKIVREFFLFCGHINEFELVKDGATDKQIAYVTFEKAEAVKTAMMLSNAVLEGIPITVSRLNEGSKTSGEEHSCSCSSCACSSCTCSDASSCSCSSCSCSNCSCSNSSTCSCSCSCSCSCCGGLKQEYKPKTAIFSEILAAGYHLTDSIIQRGIDFDASIGLSARVKDYLNKIQANIKSLDEHYKVSETVTAKAVEINEKFAVQDKVMYAATQVQGTTSRALDTNAGKKMAEFYLNTSKQAIDVHQEAMRIANEKKTTTSSEVKEVVQQ